MAIWELSKWRTWPATTSGGRGSTRTSNTWLKDALDACTHSKILSCHPCTRGSFHLIPDSPWHRVHIDYAGPFMGHMFLIVIDAHSKWAEVVPTDSSTSSKTMDILLTIFARFGLPKQIVSDNAPNFTSDEFKNFVRSNAIKHITSAPYHPATNGIAERFVQIFKNAMKSAKKYCGSLHTKLSKFLLAYRNSQHHTTGESPARLLLGRSTRIRLDCLRPSLLEKVTQSQSGQVRHHSQARARVFNTGDNVLTRDYRAADRGAHGTIKARNGPLSYSIQTSPGIVWRRHADQIVHTQTEATDPDHTQPGATDPNLILPISLPKDTTRSQSAEPNPVTVPPPAPIVASTSASPSNLDTQPRRSGRIKKPPVKFNLWIGSWKTQGQNNPLLRRGSGAIYPVLSVLE